MTDGPYNLDDYSDEGERPAASRKRGGGGSRLPKGLPEQGDPPDRFAAFITEFAHLTDDPVVSADRWGVEGSEPIELVLRSGTRITWAEQDHLFGPRLQRPLVMVTGHKPRSLTQQDVQLVAWAIIQLATLRAAATEADEFHELWASYEAARQVISIDRNNEPAMRAVLLSWRHLAEVRGDEVPFVLEDVATHERLIRRLDFAVHVRAMKRGPMAWSRLHGMARKVGWELDRIQYRATTGGAPYVDAKVFVVPADWGHDA